MNRRLKWRSPALLGVGIVVGALLGSTLWVVSATHAQSTPKSSALPVATWHELPQVNAKFLKWVLHAKVENSQGKEVTLASDHRPILFSAPYCPWCAKTEKLLIAHHLLGKVQIVGVSLTGGGMDIPLRPLKVTNAKEAQAVFARDWHYYRIKASTTGLDFALPGSPIDQAVQSFPLVLIPSGDHWYVQVGYNPSVQFWKSILS